MNVNLLPADADFIQAKVEHGYYQSATELVHEAIRRLREDEESMPPALKAALELGDRDIREGRTVLYTPELLEQIERNAIRHAAEGRKPNPDVCP